MLVQKEWDRVRRLALLPKLSMSIVSEFDPYVLMPYDKVWPLVSNFK